MFIFYLVVGIKGTGFVFVRPDVCRIVPSRAGVPCHSRRARGDRLTDWIMVVCLGLSQAGPAAENAERFRKDGAMITQEFVCRKQDSCGSREDLLA